MKDEIDDTSNEEMQEEVRFTSIREMLEAMENFGDDEDSGDDEDDNTNLEFYNLYDQFEDVLTYHEQRKAKLREALMS